jgi:hypothetical protein
MKRLLLTVLLLLPCSLGAQTHETADSNARLTYRFQHSTETPRQIAIDGLASFNAVLVSVDLEWGDSVAQITGRVKNETWAQDPEVWGGTPGHEQIYFGHIRTYLGGDPRFRILVKPSRCTGCAGIREAVFLRYNETGYLVGRPRRE